jgi:peptide/nickel transport system substrate-binding protein
MQRLLAVFLIISSPLIFSINIPINAQTQTLKKGAFVDQVNFIHYLDENLALQDLKAGKIDTYFANIPLQAVSDAQSDPTLNVYQTTGEFSDLLLNPAPAKASSGDLNPFSIRQVRFAMNYLVDRDFVVNEILKGYGTPLMDPFGIYSPEYLNVINTVQSFGFRHSPEIAQKLISDAMLRAGAMQDSNGKWIYNGKAVTLKILIRSDIDYRKSIGEAVASDLEKIGFTVVRDYGDLNKANAVVYGSDPQDLKWNIYPEGFASSAFAKYNPASPAEMYAPWYSRMPGSQNPAFWNYKNSTLDKVTQKIVFGNFSSEGERNNLLRSAVKDGIQESVRVFIATNIDPYIATKNVKGLINDFGAGITSRLSPVNSRLANNSTTLNIGMKEIYVGAWNNIAGFSDRYAVIEAADLTDPAVIVHPYNGEVIPFRTPWTDIQTNGPHGKLSVAPGTIIWDPINQHWKKVGSNNGNNSTAISKVTYDLIYSRWHNGVMMDKNDLLYSSYFGHQWGTNTGRGDKTIDSEYTSQAAQAIKYDKGIRFLSDNKVESYLDFWHFDKKEIAGAGTVWASEPWEITAASERLVENGVFAFSKTDSTSKSIDWLSLIVPSHANAIKDELQKMKAEGYVPIALRDTVTVDDAKKRYDASINWITQHNNAIIGNGPFYLDNYNPAGGVITIKAFRDNSYPFYVGYWNKYEHPKLASIENVNELPRILHIGQPMNMMLRVNVDGKPSNNATVNYYLSNSEGNVVVSGSGKPMNNRIGSYSINLNSSETNKLSNGPATLKIFASSFDAYKPAIITRLVIAVRTSGTTHQ